MPQPKAKPIQSMIHIFPPTLGQAVNLYRSTHAVDWKDWDEQ
jgi:hypothetical protein